jgi:hypothetical protein
VTVGVTLTVLMDNEMVQITAMIGNVLNVKTVISHSVRNVTDVVLKKKAEHLALLAKEVTEAVEEMVETETAEIAEEIILVDPITEVVVMKTAWTGIGNVLNAIIITSQEEMSVIDVAWLVQAAEEEILDAAAVAATEAAAEEEILDAAAVAATVAVETVEEIPVAAAVAVATVAVETVEEILVVAEETIQHREENQKSQNLEDLKERKMGTLITVPLVKSGHKVTKELEIRRDWNGCRTPLLRCG